MMEDRVRSEKCKDPPQLFTYYQGDINTAVDEHFFRALNKATIPKDLSTKVKDTSRMTKSDVPSTSSWSNFSALTWSKPTHSTGSSKLTQLASLEAPPPSQGVIVNPSGLSSSSSASLWPCPPRQGTAFDLPQILYQQPMSAESSSYLNLLQMDRPTGGIMISPFSKSDSRPEWNSASAFKDGSRIGLDSGVSVSEISKDLYWF